ncbi:hypothetical protein F9Y90_04860 (plasmid) [Borrelia miyamotoi]|uniref:Uncharacterized protein n=1 Tax=Borrelia miyamotoi TaxID=47466 RepID=A0A5P8AUK5_9SPIR|nr:hypothetical protein [Borrelia miyamotoi]QFP42439.1 hypothetical protein F9Y90_04860 [Borrelia miyamotoi]WAZ72305.1 hypothetical protein O5404_04610 [Borrelia miyamotoi]WVI05301.1 hypothetical protein F9Y91_00265 [Borrelia miyamotoi]
MSSIESMGEELDKLKIKIKDALMQYIISCRFTDVDYILIKTANQPNDLHLKVNSELPIGFTYMDYSRMHDLGADSNHIHYYFKNKAIDISSSGFTTLEMHKNRLII